jgi:YD repeat-containing protein
VDAPVPARRDSRPCESACPIRLTSVTVNGVTSIFFYDAAGRLVRKDSAGATVSYFLWNRDNLLAELGPAATTKRAEYGYYGMDNLHAVIEGSTPYYAHSDALGNVRGLTNQGQTYATYSYDEGGHVLAGGGANRARWKGALYMAPEAGLLRWQYRDSVRNTSRSTPVTPRGTMGC